MTPIENKNGLVSLSLKFNEETVPLAYKLRINDYLTYNRKHFLDQETKEQEQTKGDAEGTEDESSKTIENQEQENSKNTD